MKKKSNLFEVIFTDKKDRLHRLFALLLVSVFLIHLQAPAQQKVVYTSIDVSGSMSGDKYNLANYMVQMITALLEDDDELWLAIGGEFLKKNLTGDRAGEIQQLQKPFNSYRSVTSKSEIADINAFNLLFRNQPNKDQWFFIVGDGIWLTGGIAEEFEKVISEHPVRTFFLETMNSLDEHGDFGKCMDKLPFVTQYRSSNDPETIIGNCIKVATSLFGVSDHPATVRASDVQCYSFTPNLPIEKIYVVFQDEVSVTALPTLLSVMSGNGNIPIVRQSVVSTEKLRDKTGRLLSGRVAVIIPASPIPAGQLITLCFDKDINPARLNVYPMSKIDIGLKNGGGITVETGNAIENPETNETIICLENNTANIRYNLLDKNGNALDESILRQVVTHVQVGNNRTKATLRNGFFECEIPLGNEEITFYSIEAEYPGYFKISTGQRKIVRSAECDRVLQGEPIFWGSIGTDIFKNNKCLTLSIVDLDNRDHIYNPADFYLEVKRNYSHLFRKIDIRNITDKSFDFCFSTYGMWCECFLPDTLTITVHVRPKNSSVNPIDQPFKFHIDKSSRTWLERCGKVIIALIANLLLIWYLRLLQRKKRFKKGACIKSQYHGVVASIKGRKNSEDLRRKGLWAWIDRWWIPFTDESNALSFRNADNRSFSFMATNSNNYVEIPKGQYDINVMNSSDFKREDMANPKKKMMRLTDSTPLRITRRNEMGMFELCYDREKNIKNDVPAFRIFIGLIIFTAVLFEIFLACFLITSLF